MLLPPWHHVRFLVFLYKNRVNKTSLEKGYWDKV